LRRFALKCFSGLHIESFYNLTIFGATFRMWGRKMPLSPPLVACRLVKWRKCSWDLMMWVMTDEPLQYFF